ncbi:MULTISPECIES: aromatic acid/H+ symport family MFS transporter [unclassified Rhodococcus (in: high G+C Gram-positive bacteria)]|uniref:MFS transporter n=1 Tax=unclassified Rhodococcus (in: high G+C Gram-positive bacteria) TaxID=192944 RepID=UPI00163AD740|nr:MULTISPECIES: aromatic acid/H+ symport family MFS transporter [unclassified Rhodococcus (in: high G+C Gram-positive bacteria)]MBC2642299.1 aromatic acid/H+ symport family MFS transporter [Rhodococcus sp. 3A]MBC2892958.1 aromatic acid/H+ symport family MFS transporter [Rhodococcus sp. 4CII]
MNRSNPDTWASPRHRSAVIWVVAIATIAIIFDGYDLVVYGTILPTLMNDPSQLGEISAQQAGALGSYALIGVMVGALTAGAVGDHLGRRRMMLINIVWFSLGMGLAAMSTSVTMFGLLRFFTGIGVGGLVATAGAMVAEFAPPGKRNLYNAIVYSGVPAGGVLASLLAIVLRDTIGWRGLFWIGALPIVILLPLALVKLPESPKWLVARGHEDKVGFAALATRRYAWGTALLGLMSFSGLLLTYGLNTWLPKIMEDAGFNAKGSLSFLLVLNGGAILGGLIASKVADGIGPQRVVATTFGLAALALILLTLGFPLPVLLASVAVAGVGTIGTQVLIYGFVSNYYSTSARGAGVAWCAGFGRLGGIFGPLIGGALISAGISSQVAFYVFAGIAVLGGIVTFFVPRARAARPEVTTAYSTVQVS